MPKKDNPKREETTTMQLYNRRNFAVTWAASKQESRFTINAIEVTPQETVATDGHVLCRVSTPTMKPENFPFVEGFTPNGFKKGLIPTKDAVEIEKAIPKKQTSPVLEYAAVAVTSTETGYDMAITDLDVSRVFHVKQTNGKFPTWEQVFPRKAPVLDICFDARLLKRVLDAAVKFSDADSKRAVAIRMQFGEDRMQFGEDPKYGPEAMRCDVVNSDGQEMNVIVMPLRDSDTRSKFMPPPEKGEKEKKA